MKHLIKYVLFIVFFSQVSMAQEEGQSVMRMICLKTTVASMGQSRYTGRVYVIEQSHTDDYEAEVFTNPHARLNGRIPHTTNHTDFNIRVFANVDQLEQVTSFEALADQLVSTDEASNTAQIQARGYRSNMAGDRKYTFFWNEPSEGMIQFNVESPSSTFYQDGADGGTMECHSPYTVATHSAPEILNEEVIATEVLASNAAQ